MLVREQIDFLLTKAYNAAVRAGFEILEIYNGSEIIDVDIKSDSTPLTTADRKAHDTIKQYLNQTRIPLLSEEGRDILYIERQNCDLFWMVDPLDGTKEFLKRNGEFTVNIALLVNNKPLFGVVYVPCLNKMYFNDPDRGAFVAKVDPTADAEFSINQIFKGTTKLPLLNEMNNPVKVAVSRSHINAETDELVKKIEDHYGEIEQVVQGSSYKLCLIAEGTVDYYPRTSHTFEWDTAAGQAIAESSGAEIVSLEGKELGYNKEDLQNPFFICRSKNVVRIVKEGVSK